MEITPLRGDGARSQYHHDVGTVDRESSMPVGPSYSFLVLTLLGHSYRSHLAHQYRYFLKYVTKGLVFIPNRSTSALSALSLRAGFPVASASSRSHARCYGQHEALLCTVQNYGGRFSLGSFQRQALISQTAPFGYEFPVPLLLRLRSFMTLNQYSIVLYPRRVPDKSEREPLLSEEVLLTLHNAAGVVPRSLAPAAVAPQPVESRRSATTRNFFAS
jgi:hypothetical protein